MSRRHVQRRNFILLSSEYNYLVAMSNILWYAFLYLIYWSKVYVMSTQFDNYLVAPELSASEKALRDLFVQEYLKDYDAFCSCLRCGFHAAYAVEYAKQFMQEPYVQQKIKSFELDRGIENEGDRDRNLVLSTLRKQMQYAGQGASHAARVNAAVNFAKLIGMEPPTKTRSEVNITSPIQFYLPQNGRDFVTL